jgi:hypothetical protein
MKATFAWGGAGANRSAIHLTEMRRGTIHGWSLVNAGLLHPSPRR